MEKKKMSHCVSVFLIYRCVPLARNEIMTVWNKRANTPRQWHRITAKAAFMHVFKTRWKSSEFPCKTTTGNTHKSSSQSKRRSEDTPILLLNPSRFEFLSNFSFNLSLEYLTPDCLSVCLVAFVCMPTCVPSCLSSCLPPLRACLPASLSSAHR